jgi:sulfatase maturation enzyme AslB (radical SAM superfamily)
VEVIFENSLLKRILGNNEEIINKDSINDFKFTRFCINKEIKDGILVYNSLIGSMVLLSKDEFTDVSKREDVFKYLHYNFYISNDSKYIESMANKIQGYIRANKPKRTYKSINTVTILPSTGCNAKCFYCFEKGAIKKHMDYDTADKVIDYIVKHYNGKMLKVRWFGGEPLINEKIITYISEKLIENGINFISSLTSNCFLISEDKINLYKDVWHLKRVSVTIDGTEDVYNNVKAFTYSGSAYKKVLRNIEVLRDSKLRVSIRINVGEHNLDDVEILVKELLTHFGESKNVNIYLNRLYDDCGGAPENGDKLLTVFNKIIKITTFLSKYGKGGNRVRINHPLRTTQCMSDSGSAVMILPDGKLGLCEHYMDDNHIGDIVNGVTDFEVVKKCCEQVDKCSTCEKCFLYPTCCKLKVCNGAICTDEMLVYTEYYVKKAMVKEYRKYKKRQSTDKMS